MLTAHPGAGPARRLPDPRHEAEGAVWLDLLDGTEAERVLAGRLSGLRVPAREEIAEIENSSRLQRDGDTLTLSTTIVAKPDAGAPIVTPLAMVLSPRTLLTVRYSPLQAFDSFAARLAAGPGAAGPGSAGSGNAGSAGAGSGGGGSGDAGTGTVGIGTAGTGTAGSGAAGTGTAGPGVTGSGTTGSGAAGSGATDFGAAGSGAAGSGAAGAGGAGEAGTDAPCSTSVFLGLMEALIDRVADILEHVGAELDLLSHRIFRAETRPGRGGRSDAALRDVLRRVGQAGDLVSHLRDALLGLGRIVAFAAEAAASWMPHGLRGRCASLRADIASLSDYDAQMTGKAQFLLDATLGFLNIEQNNGIKVLTVVSLVGIPPTLVASIYGMNFKDMPELNWAWGYPYALGVIAASVVVPLALFRWRGWL